jgi:hypothetical protein
LLRTNDITTASFSRPWKPSTLSISSPATGSRTQPFRYWLPEREAVWRTEPRWQAAEQRRQYDEELFRSMAEANGCTVADLFTPGAMARRFERGAPGEGPPGEVLA